MVSFLSLFTACSSLTVIDVYKEKHVPGLPNLDKYVLYTLLFESDEPFTLNGLDLYSGKVKMPIASYAIINLKDFSGQTVLDNNKPFNQGNYKITFRIDTDANFVAKQDISIRYSIKDRSRSKRESIDLKEKVVSNK
jgi:hypothetical protein